MSDNVTGVPLPEVGKAPKWEEIGPGIHRFPWPEGGWLVTVVVKEPDGERDATEAAFYVPPEPLQCPHGTVGICMYCIRDQISYAGQDMAAALRGIG